jgi:hypothetical protein
MVEIAPLLAFQFHVDTERSAVLCADLPHPPQLSDTLPICQPVDIEERHVQTTHLTHGTLIRDSSLNLRVLGAGPVGADPAKKILYVGVGAGVGGPWTTVTRFNGRCYLSNGYHRVFGLQAAGATYIPCLLVDATEFTQVGAIGGGATFERTVLESANPPTCGHLTDARAYRIILHQFSRVIHVTWAEYAVRED